MAILTPADLAPFADIDPAKAEAMIEDAEAMAALAAPCIIVILLVIRVLDKFKGNPLVDSIFKALRPASIGMITAALIGVVKASLLHLENWAGIGTILAVFNWKGIVLAVALWFIMKKWKTHPIAYIAIAAAAGIVFSF